MRRTLAVLVVLPICLILFGLLVLIFLIVELELDLMNLFATHSPELLKRMHSVWETVGFEVLWFFVTVSVLVVFDFMKDSLPRHHQEAVALVLA
jgi:hypothetical protein